MDVRDVKVGTFIRGDNDEYLYTNRDMYLGVITGVSEDLYDDEHFTVMVLRHKNDLVNRRFYAVEAKYFQVVNPDSITPTPEETEVLDIVFNTFVDLRHEEDATVNHFQNSYYNVSAIEAISCQGLPYLLGNKDKLFRIRGKERFVGGKVIK